MDKSTGECCRYKGYLKKDSIVFLTISLNFLTILFICAHLCLKSTFQVLSSNLQVYDNFKKVKLATVVEGNPMAPFSIATTPRCRGGGYSFPWIVPLNPWSVPYNSEC